MAGYGLKKGQKVNDQCNYGKDDSGNEVADNTVAHSFFVRVKHEVNHTKKAERRCLISSIMIRRSASGMFFSNFFRSALMRSWYSMLFIKGPSHLILRNTIRKDKCHKTERANVDPICLFGFLRSVARG